MASGLGSLHSIDIEDQEVQVRENSFYLFRKEARSNLQFSTKLGSSIE